jgi:hypothetical protein
LVNQQSAKGHACLLCVAVVAAGGRTAATKQPIVLAAWSTSHGACLLCVAASAFVVLYSC